MSKIDPIVIEQLATVRDSGAVNMFDINGVQHVANEKDLFKLVIFIEENSRTEYGNALEEMGKQF